MNRNLVPYDDDDSHELEITGGDTRLPVTYTPEGIAAMHEFAPPPGSPPIRAQDQPLVASFLSALRGAPPSFLVKALRWYSELGETIDAVEAERDQGDRAEGLHQLKLELGAAAQSTIDDAVRYHQSLPRPLARAIEEARLPDGRRLANSAMGVRWLAELGRGQRTGTTSAQRIGLDAEIREIEEIMRTDRRRYTRDEHLQARYRELLARRGS